MILLLHIKKMEKNLVHIILIIIELYLQMNLSLLEMKIKFYLMLNLCLQQIQNMIQMEFLDCKFTKIII